MGASGIILLISNILSLSTQAASAISAIEQSLQSPSATTTAEQQAQIKADIQAAQVNFAAIIQHSQAALNNVTTAA